MTRRTVRIGGAAGAWGDTAFAAEQLLEDGRCHYIIFEGLAEITMAILARAQRRDPKLGYATDIIELIARDIARYASARVKVITNAGGMNPERAAELLREAARAARVELRVGVVQGDQLLPVLPELQEANIQDERGEPLPESPLSFNAYLGARPIAAALGVGADIVITGRCVDSALTLGPLMHEFGWGLGVDDDLDQLAQGSLAGHLIECGPQATGGLLTDWRDTGDWDDIGYPIVEVEADGGFVLTKATSAGGLVDLRSVSEQLLYEIGDPARYLLPDVSCDFRNVELREVGPDRVAVSGARGRRPPETLKACAHVLDGYRTTMLLFVGGREAVARAERLGDAALRRVARRLRRDGFEPLRDSHLEVLGSETTYGVQTRARGTREVVLKIAMHHDAKEALQAAVRELPSFGLVVAGVTGGGAGLPKPSPRIALHNVAVPRELVEDRLNVTVDDDPVALPPLPDRLPEASASAPSTTEANAGDLQADGAGEAAHTGDQDGDGATSDEPTITVPLISIAHARSGDKGAHANIGVRARHPDFLPTLRRALTPAVVRSVFAHVAKGDVLRYELPGIDAMNFLMLDALGGGGVASLRFDPQGKAYAQQLLDMPLEVPAAWRAHEAFRAYDP